MRFQRNFTNKLQILIRVAAPDDAPSEDAAAEGETDVVDAEYEVVDEDEDKDKDKK